MSDAPDMPEDDVLAAELVLSLLEGEEREAALRKYGRDPAFVALVADWQERLVAMTDDIAAVRPPRRSRKKLMKRLFGSSFVPLSERLWVWKGLSLAAIALAAYMGIQQLGPVPQDARVPVYATQLTGDATELRVLAVLNPAASQIAINRVAGEAAADRVFELWAILPDEAPVSLGVLPNNPAVRIALPPDLVTQAAQITLAISDEPPGGSPTGAPTGAVLAASPVSEL